MDESIVDTYQDRLEREVSRLRVDYSAMRHDLQLAEAENESLRRLLREALEWPVPMSYAADVRAALAAGREK
jgi:hypothetical protein